ncbi:MAG: hypothetical protein AVDCRST_MAG90-713 [uncultured Microvirga sp.]|uniref:Uncharacterized protein n=1 Tax=uncultured Microvirga sp. TaxID=412392 RepID=A0A6J4KV88_9HYPH|nr:MAG: hypothetical protein AVDCRST_MAG90-713 [uncultured Microvirga sp.]
MHREAGTVRDDAAAAGLARRIDKIVSDIEAFKWERTAEPVWAARVEVAAVYFRKRSAGKPGLTRSSKAA